MPLPHPIGMKRITISLDDDMYELIEKEADRQIRSVSNLTAALVIMKLRDMLASGEIKKAK